MRFSTRSDFDKVQREIQKRKFYATLPHKIDTAVEDYKKETGHSDPEIASSYLEEGVFREDGWYIRKSLDDM